MAVIDTAHRPSAELTYRELNNEMSALAGGLQALGLEPKQCVSIFSENSHRWLIMDQVSCPTDFEAL